MPNKIDLNGRFAAVTGGAQGIGRAVALRFARAGYAVSIADPDAAAGRETVRMVEDAGVKCLFVRTDVGIPAQIEKWIARFLLSYMGKKSAAKFEKDFYSVDMSSKNPRWRPPSRF